MHPHTSGCALLLRFLVNHLLLSTLVLAEPIFNLNGLLESKVTELLLLIHRLMLTVDWGPSYDAMLFLPLVDRSLLTR
jgi:hypothetical protein